MTNLQKIERIIKPVSWLTLLLLLVVAVLRRGFGIEFLPPRVELYLFPVLTAGAVGYLTNYIAIWMLFKPYEPHSVLGFRFQGVIPREKAELGEALGEQIPKHLLKPEEISAELGAMVRDILNDPALLEDIRGKVSRYLDRNAGAVAAFLLPHIGNVVREALRKNMTPENVSLFYDRLVMETLNKQENRELLSKGIVYELRNRAPEFTAILKEQLKESTQNYIREEYPRLSTFLKADVFAARLVEYLNWKRIESQIADKLGEERTQVVVAQELSRLTVKLQEYLRSPEAAGKVKGFLDENSGRMESFLMEFLSSNIPPLVDSLLRREEFWQAVEERFLPALQEFTDHYLKRQGSGAIQKALDLSGRIRRSVDEMDVAELHGMIDRVSGEHLVAIQLLGYLLGMIAGGLLILAG